MLKILIITSGFGCGVTNYTKKLIFELKKHKNIELECSELRPGFFRLYLLREIFQKKPDIIHIQHEIVMFDDFLGISSIMIYMYAIFMRKKIVTTFHTVKSLINFENEIAGKYLRYPGIVFFAKQFIKYSFKLIDHFSDRIIVLTEASKSVLEKEYKIRNVKYIFHGFFNTENVDMDDITAFRKELGIGLDEKVILLFGYPFEKKGYHHVIKSLPHVIKKHPKTKVVITGGIANADPDQTISYLTILKKLSIELGVEKHVIFTDYIPDEKVPHLIASSQLAVFPFEDRQTASGSLLTVYPYKKPLVVSDIPVMDFLDDEVDSIKVEKGNENEIASAINLIFDDPNITNKLQSNMNDRIESLSIGKMAEEHFKLYKELAAI